MYIFYYLLLIAVLTEALTEILIKSVVVKPIRFFLISKINKEQFTYLLSCGYCFSFWVAVTLNFTSFLLIDFPTLITYKTINYCLIVVLTHRLSNILHGAIDKYFDKRYDIRYNKED